MYLELKAKDYATKCHSETNHYYNNEPYTFHLQMVVDYAKKFIHLLYPNGDLFLDKREIVYAGAWCHDTIEDTRQTYNDVKEAIGLSAADIVYRLTNEKGKNRSERGNEKYYNGIKEDQSAAFVKICDRLANVKFSKDTGSKMFAMYTKEHEDFKDKLYTRELAKMFMELDQLIYS